MPAIEALTACFYDKVGRDPILAPIFQNKNANHAAHVAKFIAEVFGGGAHYTEAGGSHAGMISHHLARHLTEAQRRRWLALILDAADEVGLPQDPEFRSALLGYLEWGTRLAVINSQLPKQDASEPQADLPMPRWDWGPPGGPYRA
ncbi:MAG: group II truncated hemoglobin [Burkholderiaceae bacterium]|nr:group II truncated hemoglobin [Burkholderiaceae bacterium]